MGKTNTIKTIQYSQLLHNMKLPSIPLIFIIEKCSNQSVQYFNWKNISIARCLEWASIARYTDIPVSTTSHILFLMKSVCSYINVFFKRNLQSCLLSKRLDVQMKLHNTWSQLLLSNSWYTEIDSPVQIVAANQHCMFWMKEALLCTDIWQIIWKLCFHNILNNRMCTIKIQFWYMFSYLST